MNEARAVMDRSPAEAAPPGRSGFYACLAYLMVVGVIAGFWPTYYGAVLGTGIAPPRPGWLMAGYGVFAAVFGVYASVQLELHRHAFTGNLDLTARRLFLDLGTIGLFAGFLFAAIRSRRQPELHKRFMVVATCTLAAPGLARLSMRVLELPTHPALNLVVPRGATPALRRVRRQDTRKGASGNHPRHRAQPSAVQPRTVRAHGVLARNRPRNATAVHLTFSSSNLWSET